MIQLKKLKNGLSILLAIAMVGQPLGVYAEDFVSEAEVESFAEEETDAQMETEDGEESEEQDLTSEDEISSDAAETTEPDEVTVEDTDSIGDGSGETDGDEIEFSDEEVMDEAGAGITWNYDYKTSILTVSGSGEMRDYADSDSAPWSRLLPKKLIIEDGVKNIGNNAFSSMTTLKTLEISHVETIGKNAFYSCTGLSEVKMTQAKTIGNGAFYGCSSLESVEIPQVETLEDSAFGECRKLTTMDMPHLKTIAASVFNFCTRLSEVKMPQAETIGARAFEGCSSLKAIDLTSIKIIEKYAFSACSIEKIVVPSTLTKIGEYAFNCAKRLKTVFFQGNTSPSISYSDAFDQVEGITFYYPVNGSWPASIMKSTAFGSTGSKWVAYDRMVPGEYVFNNDGTCSSDGTETAECICGCGETDTRTAKNTKNPDNHTYSEDCYKELCNGKKVYYCKGCGRIKGEPEEKGTCGDSLSWEIYDSDVLYITGTGAMTDYDIDNPAPWSEKNIRYCRLGKGITSVGTSAFENCASLEGIELEEGITSIEGYAFYGCTSLKELDFPKSLKSVGESAFEGCTSLQKVTAYPKLTSVKSTSFRKCSALTFYGYEGSYIQKYATDKEIPFKSMGKWGICGDSAEWYLVDGTLTITGYNEMSDYSETNKAPWSGLNVTKIVVEKYVSTIGNYAFADLNGVTEITLPNTIYNIGEYAFKNCTGIKSIEIPESLELGIIRTGMFSGCTALETIKLPDNIQAIEDYAFSDCKKLSSFTVPKDVTKISEGAFKNCESLSSVTMGDDVTAIEKDAFSGCGLTEIQLPSGVTTIGENAFAGNKFTSSTIPAGVTELGAGAFSGCEQLQAFYVEEGSKTFSASAGVLFDNGGTKLILCPGGKEGSFTLPRRTTEIAEAAFKDCKNITELILPSGLTTIRSRAFSGMNLTTIELPADLVDLSPDAFIYCYKLTEITVDEDNTVFAATDGVLCDRNKEKVLICPPGLEKIVLGEGIKSVEAGAITAGEKERVIDLPFYLEKIALSDDFKESTVFEVYENARVASVLERLGYKWRSKGNYDLPWEGEKSAEYHKAMAYEKLNEYLSKYPNQTVTKENGTLTADGAGINFTHVTSTGKASGTMSFRITEKGVENNKFTLEVKTAGSDGSRYGFVATLTIDPAKLTSKTADYNYTWSIKKGTYCTVTTENANTMANSALYNGVACLAADLLPETDLKIKDLGFLGMFNDSTIHTFKVEEGKEATCTDDGYGASAWCPLCGATKIRGSVIHATGHKYGDWAVKEEATCTKEGTETSTCANCGDVKTRVIEKKAHTEEVIPASEATCDKPGLTEGIKCSVCGEILKAQTETGPATGHTYGDWVVKEEATCVKEGTKVRTCTKCNDKQTEIIEKKAHTEETVPAVAPTCAKPGLTEGIKCSVCGEILKKQETGAPATGKHNYSAYKVVKEATVMNAGSKTRSCSVCGKKDTVNIPKLTPAIKLNATSIPLKVKQSTKKITVSGLAKGDSVVSWKSGNPKVVKVNNSGKITAGKKTGKATVTVTLRSGKTASITVKVQKKPAKTTRIAGLTSKVTLKAKEKLTLKPEVLPVTSVQKITYISSNKKVATVSKKGVITAKKAGKTKITVRSGAKKYVITVTVQK